MNILEVKHLSKYYGNEDNLVKAVDDVSFTVKEGEFVVILGASGCGKSTLLHMLAGVDTSSKGEILVNGENLVTMKGDKATVFRRQHIALIYQFYNLIPVLNVEENIVLPLKLDHRKTNEQELEKILQLLKLENRRYHLPSQLSGGQQQRVAIARSLLMKSQLLLADEPTGNLDKNNREEITAYLHKINKERKQTIIMVTHDVEIAKQADRILIMEDGKFTEERKSA